MLTLSHPTGNSNIRQVVWALEEAGLLEEFWTCLSWNPQSAAASILPSKLRKQLERRTFAAELRTKIHVHPWREIGRLLAPTLKMSGLTRHETGPLSVDAVFHSLDRKVAARIQHIPTLRGVYAGEDCALETFRVAKRLGLQQFYDLPIAYWQVGAKLLAEEAERWPQWEPTLVGTRDSEAKLARKTEELSLADVVFVPSSFVRDSLPSALMQGKTCCVAEFGSPEISSSVTFSEESPFHEAEDSNPRPLRVLFVGSMTQRKGLADLFEAMRLLKRRDVELIVMGSPVETLEFYQRLLPFRYEAPRPQYEVFRLMHECDVLVLPSIVEGRALVQQEAMSCGLPLIVTPNAGGEDLIVEGQTGFLVPIRCPEIIAEKINWLADNRFMLPEMRTAARSKARQYDWNDYRRKIALAIKKSLN